MNINIRKRLSLTLSPIYELEISLGNIVARVDEPAGTSCPFAVILKNRLHHNEIKTALTLSPEVEKWENKDRHYPLEAGYVCRISKHVIAGPLA